MDRKMLARLVARYDAESRVRHFGCRQQLICVVFAQLTWREGLHNIASCNRIPRNTNTKKMPSIKIFLASGFFLVNFFSIFDSVKSWREIAAEEKILDSINGITIEKPYAESLGNHGLEIINGITNYTYSDAVGEPVPCYYYGLTQTGRTVLVTKSGWVNVPNVNIQQAESLNANNNIISRSNAKSWPTRMLFSSFGSIIIFLLYQISCAAERKK